jgi:RNA polymerase sigma-70 factor, ECF subfamily
MEALTRMTDRRSSDALSSAAAGDEVAFRHVIAEHHEAMRRVCRAITGEDAMADDAVQATWLVAWKNLYKVHGPEQLRPWLMSVAVNQAKLLRRKQRRRAEVEALASGRDQGVDPTTGIAGVDLHAALDRLDPDDAALLAMRYVAGFDSNELAAATGKTPAAIRQRLKRLSDRLRKDLSDG